MGFLWDLVDTMSIYERDSRKFHEIMDGNPEVRENFTSFGTYATTACAIMGVFALGGVFLNVLVQVFNKVSNVGGIFLGLFSALLGLSLFIASLKMQPYAIWQRKLNKRKIGTAALVLTILSLVLSIALIVTGAMLFASGVKSCSK